MFTNYNHCLRPSFTQNILTYLQDGTSVNVVSEVTEESDRFVIDIKGCDLESSRLLDVNMRVCREDYKGFLLTLWQQFHQKPLNECPDFFEILSDLEQAEQQFIIVLNHLDAMDNTDVDARFNQSFYQRLNSLKNYRNLALLIMTKVRYDQIVFNIKGEFKTSKLDIQQVENLPTLTMDEARSELNRRNLNLSEVHLSHIMKQADYDYVLLDYFSGKLKHPDQSWEDMSSFIQQLTNWRKEYKQKAKPSIGYLSKKLVNAIKKIFIIFKFKALFNLIKNIFSDWKIVLIEKISKIFKKRKD
jgi:hypothetical protein